MFVHSSSLKVSLIPFTSRFLLYNRPQTCLSVLACGALAEEKVALQASPTFIALQAQRDSCSGDANEVCLCLLFINPFSEIGIFSAFFMN